MSRSLSLKERLIGRLLPSAPQVTSDTNRPVATGRFLSDIQSPFLWAWQTFMREPADEHRESWEQAVGRTIEAIHNSGWLSGGIDQAVTQMCGPMLALNAQPDPICFGGDAKAAREWARAVERQWYAYATNPYECDLLGVQTIGQMCAQGVKGWFGTGEIINLSRYKLRPGNLYGTKIQMIPSARVPFAAKNPRAFQGVILDQDGFRRAYCINTFDPIQPGWVKEIEVQARDSTGRVIVNHVHDSPPTVVRGVPPLTPVLRVVKQFDQLANATLTAALLQTIFSATVESDAPTDQVLSALQGEDEQTGESMSGFEGYLDAKTEWYGKSKIDLGALSKIIHLFPGEKLNFNRSEHPNSNFKPFSRFLLLEIARCLGITYEQFTGDREGATYSSERMGSAEAWVTNLYRRQHIAGPFMSVAYSNWLEESIELGLTPFPGGIEAFRVLRAFATKCTWRGPAKPTADDLKTAKANQIKKQEGIITREIWAAEEGQDWEDIDDQRKAEQDNEDALQLKPPPGSAAEKALLAAPDEEDDDDDAPAPRKRDA